jgi:hypothetical protein
MDPNQPQKMAAACPHCGARLRLLPEHLAESFRCPKCNTSISAAPTPPPPPPNAPGAVDDAYSVADERPKPAATVKILRTSKPGEAATTSRKKPEIQVEDPVPLDKGYRAPDALSSPDPPRSDFLEAQSHRYVPVTESEEYELEAPVERTVPAEHLEPARIVQRAMIGADPLPPPPKWTFFSGVFTFPFYLDTLPRWIFLSLGLCITGELAWLTAVNFGLVGQMSEGTMVMAGFIGMPAVWIAVFSFAYAAAYCQATLLDTAEGHDVVHSWPDLGWREAFWSLPLPVYILGLSFAVGYAAAATSTVVWLAPLGVFLMFPILLLSALEADRMICPYSPAVLASLRDQWRLWGMFYIETAVLAAVWLLPVVWGMGRAPFRTLAWSAPASGAMLLIYARLIGRLAWRIAEEPEGRVGRARPGSGHVEAQSPPREPKRFIGRRKGSQDAKRRLDWQDTEAWLENPVPQAPPAPPPAAPPIPPPPTQVRRG